MNRAELLLSVLRDHRPHSRQDIFDRVGYMLTNNAASELRACGYDIQHSRKGRVDVYQLLPSQPSPLTPTPVSPPLAGVGVSDEEQMTLDAA